MQGAPAFDVGRAYASSRQTLTTELHAVTDFADAVRRHEVIAAIEKSAVCEQQPLRGWLRTDTALASP